MMNPWTALTSIAALLFYLATAITVARIRHRHNILAPAMSGHPVVERALRVQGNTLEWLVIFLPSLWMFSSYWSPYLGAALGVAWIIGRILYMKGYLTDAGKRGPGFGIQALATLILLIGAAAGAVRALMAG
jgi:glutathione S-transferase